MLELLALYALICWLLIKFKVIKVNFRSLSIMTTIGILIVAFVFMISRYYAFIDLTKTTQVTAPFIVLNTPVGGDIEKIYVANNQFVKKGDPIVKFNVERYNYQLVSLQEQLKSAQAQLDKLNRDIKRQKPLVSQTVSVAQYDTLVSQAIMQEKALNALQESINDKEWVINKGLITAPQDGYVGIIYASEGQYFNEGRPSAFSLYTTKKFVQVRIPDQFYPQLEVGSYAEFYVNTYPGRIFKARVQSVAQTTGESQGSLIAGLPLNQNVALQMIRGSTVNGRLAILEFEEPEGINIPIGSLGQSWIAGKKPNHFLGFLDLIVAIMLRVEAIIAYIHAL